MDRDLDKEKIIEKMRSLRDKRDLEILNQDLEEVNLDSDYQKKLPENKVLNIKYLGKIEINLFKITLREVEIISMKNDIALITPISKDLLYVKFAWAAVPLGPRHGRIL